MTDEQRRKAAEAVIAASEQAVARRDGESAVSYRLRCLSWVLQTPEGRAAFVRAGQEAVR